MQVLYKGLSSMRLVRLVNQTRGTTVAETVEVASTSLTRLLGLLGRSGLEAGGGLWITPSSGVHTMGMRFPIDVVGLDKDLRVTKVWNNLVPYRVTSVSIKIHSVIELAAGQIRERQIQVGDLLHVAHEC
jgi:uncharacterized membrane protein (UPF0127 family)